LLSRHPCSVLAHPQHCLPVADALTGAQCLLASPGGRRPNDLAQAAPVGCHEQPRQHALEGEETCRRPNGSQMRPMVGIYGLRTPAL